MKEKKILKKQIIVSFMTIGIHKYSINLKRLKQLWISFFKNQSKVNLSLFEKSTYGKGNVGYSISLSKT